MPTGHLSAPEHAGTLSAGKPARDAGAVSTSWTYVPRPELKLCVDDESEPEDKGGRRGAVRIAEGCNKTSMFGPVGFEMGCEDVMLEDFDRTFGIWKTRSKSSQTSLRTL